MYSVLQTFVLWPHSSVHTYRVRLVISTSDYGSTSRHVRGQSEEMR